MNTGIVLRTGIDIYKRYLKKLESKCADGDVYHITQNTFSEHYKSFSRRPMFSRYYLVYADISELEKKYSDYLEMLSKCSWVQLILCTKTKEAFDLLKVHKIFSSFRFLDCYGLPKAVIESYIRTELKANGCPSEKITKAAVTRIRRRARYKEHVLDSVLPILAKTDMALKTINSYIAPYNGVTIGNIGSRIFIPEKAAPVGALLYRYRWYIKDVYKAVHSYILSWFELYEEYACGALSEDTLLSWLEQSGKKYKLTYDYQVKAWLKSFSTYSYEFMCVAYTILMQAAHSNNSEQFLAVYKIYRMVNL